MMCALMRPTISIRQIPPTGARSFTTPTACAECGVQNGLALGLLPVGPQLKPVCVLCAKDGLGNPITHPQLTFELSLFTRDGETIPSWAWAVTGFENPYWVDG